MSGFVSESKIHVCLFSSSAILYWFVCEEGSIWTDHRNWISFCCCLLTVVYCWLCCLFFTLDSVVYCWLSCLLFTFDSVVCWLCCLLLTLLFVLYFRLCLLTLLFIVDSVVCCLLLTLLFVDSVVYCWLCCLLTLLFIVDSIVCWLCCLLLTLLFVDSVVYCWLCLLFISDEYYLASRIKLSHQSWRESVSVRHQRWSRRMVTLSFHLYLLRELLDIQVKSLTLVWTVNLTLSLSLRASEMSTCNVASVCRSTFTARGYKMTHTQTYPIMHHTTDSHLHPTERPHLLRLISRDWIFSVWWTDGVNIRLNTSAGWFQSRGGEIRLVLVDSAPGRKKTGWEDLNLKDIIK